MSEGAKPTADGNVSVPEGPWLGIVKNRQDFGAGLAVLALAVIVFWASRGLTDTLLGGLLLILGGAVSLMGVFTPGPVIKNFQDFVSGFMLLAIAMFALWAAPDLTATKVMQVGLGTPAWLFAGLVLVLAGAVTSMSVVTPGPVIKNPQDFVGGLALVGLAVFAFWASRDLTGMRGIQFGPGTTPWLFAGLLFVLGGAVAIIGALLPGPKIERYAVRGPFFICAALLTFAATIRPLGLVISSFVTMLVSAAATPDVRWGESVLVSAALTLFCAILFPYVLNLPMQLWPAFLVQDWPSWLHF